VIINGPLPPRGEVAGALFWLGAGEVAAVAHDAMEALIAKKDGPA
jgi:hypothetical protein